MNTDLISRADAEALFRNARGELHKSAIRNEQNGHPIKDLPTRDLMLLNAEQMIHLLPSVTPKQWSMTKWIFVKLHETTDPDREPVGYKPEYIFANEMPHDGQDILITVYDEQGRLVVKQDVCGIDVEEYYLESEKYDWFDDVVAWMPLPDPAESEEQA